jgi:cyclic pyranopterin monophosphate synthase
VTHFDDTGAPHMVPVTSKPETERVAIASARLTMAEATARAIAAGAIGKGDVIGVARLAGIQAAKRTAEWIPLCHPLRLTAIALDVEVGTDRVDIRATVTAVDRTGVEMEALTAASAAALTVYDMCKGIDRGIVIGPIQLEEKRGGKTGTWKRA